jgi:hypothetical protein
MVQKRINGKSGFLYFPFFIFATIILATSCSSTNPYIKYNYINGETFLNDSLNISADLFVDVNYYPVKRKDINKKIRGIKELKYKDLLVFGTTYLPPFYDLLLFYSEKNKNIGDSIQTKLLIKDTLNNRVLFKKSLNNKTIYLYLKSVNSSKKDSHLILDAEKIISSVRFDTLEKSELTYQKIFYANIDNDNYLFVKNKFETAPIKPGKKSDWNKFQYLTTILSHDASYKEHEKLLIDFELDKRVYFQEKIDSLLLVNEAATVGNKNVIHNLKEISKEEKVFMLNENHWYPNHRILATKLLAPLRENGYNYLAIEAVATYQDTLLTSDKNTTQFGKRHYPIKSTGYYTREPYFGAFIRKALELDYKIISYENFETDNRERGQAENLKKIIDNDPNAKIFVYAGLAHIYEGNAKGTKRMATYFKEITNIDPITIDQTHLFGNTNYDLTLFNADLFNDVERLNTNVDYLLINHIKPSLSEIHPNKMFNEYAIIDDKLIPYLNQELLISIYFIDEYTKYKSSSIPIVNKIFTVENNKIELFLPNGNYFLKIRDKKDIDVLSKELNVYE